MAITVLVILSFNSLCAQHAEIDSLKRQVDKQTGTKKIDALNALAFRELLIDFKLADATIERALKLSTKENYTKGLAEANIYKGICENLRGNKGNALHLLKDGILQAKKVGIYGVEGYALTQIGNIYRGSGNYDSAKFWYSRSYEVLKDSIYPWQLSVLYRNLSRVYNLTSQPKQELTYLVRSYEIRKRLSDKVLHTDILVLLSQWYLSEFNLEKAKYYIKEAEKLNVLQTLPEIQKDIHYQKAVILLTKQNILRRLLY
jgi:tetratricopeptide (TPR) repeat protein